jgi:hypothetical protein
LFLLSALIRDCLVPRVAQHAPGQVTGVLTFLHASPSWREGKNAIVVCDENDYSTAPNPDQVVLIVDADYGEEGVHSTTRYNHSSLLKTLEAGFGVPTFFNR